MKRSIFRSRRFTELYELIFPTEEWLTSDRRNSCQSETDFSFSQSHTFALSTKIDLFRFDTSILTHLGKESQTIKSKICLFGDLVIIEIVEWINSHWSLKKTNRLLHLDNQSSSLIGVLRSIWNNKWFLAKKIQLTQRILLNKRMWTSISSKDRLHLHEFGEFSGDCFVHPRHLCSNCGLCRLTCEEMNWNEIRSLANSLSFVFSGGSKINFKWKNGNLFLSPLFNGNQLSCLSGDW